jgi:hypothetical protein
MNRRIALVVFAVSLLTLGAMPSGKAEQTVYGWQLMSEQERAEHRNKMRSFQTEQQREAYRMEHHKRMQKRAQERGMTLPDQPGPRGKGMGGPGMGSGPGPGGSGKGR